jgi:hypothetical protein
VVIPETIEGYPVVGIGAAAFRGRYMRNTGRRDSQRTYIWEEAKGPGMEITAVVIPDGVKTISDSAFYFIPALHTVILPAGLETLGLDAFRGCGDLYNLVIPEATGSLVCYYTEEVWVQPPGIRSQWRTLGQAKADPRFIEEIGPRTNGFTTVKMNGAGDTFRGCGKLPLATRQRLKDLGYRGVF